MKKILLILILTIVIFSLVYFTHSERLSAITGAPLWSGMDLWQGTWASTITHKSGDFQVMLQQEGSDLIGNIKIGGSPITRGGDIKGTIDGNKLEFGLIKDKKSKLKYKGTISENSMSGSWEIPVIKDYGTWQAKKSI